MGVRAAVKTQPEVAEHAFKDNTYRFSIDELLRRHGFRIACRHKNDEPVWVRDGDHYPQGEAEDSVPRAELQAAWVAQEKYYRGLTNGRP